MTIKRTLAATTAVAATTALGIGLAVAPAAAKQGTAPLAGVLVDQNTFDSNGKDYDIVTEAVLAVLASKPSSPVGRTHRRQGPPHGVRAPGPRLHRPGHRGDRHQAGL
jgi:hypothetical protein